MCGFSWSDALILLKYFKAGLIWKKLSIEKLSDIKCTHKRYYRLRLIMKSSGVKLYDQAQLRLHEAHYPKPVAAYIKQSGLNKSG